MAYKKSVKLKFESKKDFDQINAHLQNGNIELSSFVTFCVSRVWSEILREHQSQQQALLEQQKAKEENGAVSDEPSSNTEAPSVSESVDSEKQEDGQAITSEANG